MGIILLIIVLFLVFGGLPVAPWGSWHAMGWGPSGLGLVLLIVLIVLLGVRRL